MNGNVLGELTIYTMGKLPWEDSGSVLGRQCTLGVNDIYYRKAPMGGFR